jgi:hypothetical protein
MGVGVMFVEGAVMRRAVLVSLLLVVPTVARAEEKTVTIKAGESFTISLPWSTTATWEPSLSAEAKKAVEVKAPGPAPGGMPGASKLRDYNFKALQAGEYTFEMQKREVGTNRLLDAVKVTVKIR